MRPIASGSIANADLDASTALSSRIARCGPGSDPRVVGLFAGHFLDFAGDAMADAIRERAHARVVGVARTRQVDHLLVEDTTRPRPHEDDAIRQADGLPYVVRHEDHRLSSGAPNALDLSLQDLARLSIERRERLVHQKHRRVRREAPRNRTPLPHSTGQLVRIPIAKPPKVHQAQKLFALRRARLRARALQLLRKLDVLLQGQPWKQGGVLENHSAIRSGRVDQLAASPHAPVSGPSEARDQVQNRGLAAA